MKKVNILQIITLFFILLIMILLFMLNDKSYIVNEGINSSEGIKPGFEAETYEIEKKSEENPKSPGSGNDKYSENIWEYYDRVEEARERTIKGS